MVIKQNLQDYTAKIESNGQKMYEHDREEVKKISKSAEKKEASMVGINEKAKFIPKKVGGNHLSEIMKSIERNRKDEAFTRLCGKTKRIEKNEMLNKSKKGRNI
jgi:hypothetical protein